MDLAQYAIKGTEAEWESATKGKKAGKNGSVGNVSVKSQVRVSRCNSKKYAEKL